MPWWWGSNWYDGTVTVNVAGQLTINSFVGWTLGGTASLNGGTDMNVAVGTNRTGNLPAP